MEAIEEMLGRHERRLDVLESGVLDRLAAENAFGLMLRAIMATHPEPRRLLAAFDVLVSSYEVSAGDQGFELGHDSRIPQSVLDRMRPSIDLLRAALQGAAPASPSAP